MTATEIYDQLHTDLKSITEVFFALPELKPFSGMAHEEMPAIYSEIASFKSEEIIACGAVNILARFVNKNENLVAGSSQHKTGIAEFLKSFEENREKIILLFETIVNNPDLRIYYGYEQYYTLEDQLLNFTKNLHSKEREIQEKFAKVIMVVDSEYFLH